ncbi:hypothetical protein TraAM80_07608 [Trypanosoma rangeli]|uniref:Uncharacterized protein n=1 Tax=Trypanosoma rangeli TaxID=5698 RepID=A0A3R7MDJ2_TRYRA|nr:uncharacterized protein TraAM80_07608 [Trypanosoma rangeli]RNF00600.1 hypothetical protein TraAM80_07608 [Trypanosoma rangeli]|eukprot:RNF00600.1 hypothetical protein TraAM80_07608 [Trypanosoma rangeli]
MKSRQLKLCTYRFDGPHVLCELRDSGGRRFQDSLPPYSVLEQCCSKVVDMHADLVALQNVHPKKMVEKLLLPPLACSHTAGLGFAYNTETLRLKEKKEVNLFSLVLCRAKTELGYASCLPSFRFRHSEPYIPATYALFEMVADANDPPVSFIALNCDFSRTPAKLHSFRCALISEMIRVLYEDINLTECWGTGRVLLLGSFKSPRGSLPYDYLTRFSGVTEEEFQVRATRSEVPPIMENAASSPCVVRRWCFLNISTNRVRQLHHLTNVVIEARGGSLDSVRELELTTLHDEVGLPGVVKRDTDRITLLFNPPYEVTGTQRHFRLAWREYRESSTSPLLELGSEEYPIRLYRLSHGYSNSGLMEKTGPRFRSIYASCIHQQPHCGMEALLDKHAKLQNVTVPFEDTSSKLHIQQVLPRGLGCDNVSFRSWGRESLLPPFEESSTLGPQSTAFSPQKPCLGLSVIPTLEATAEGCEEEGDFVCGTQDYILYSASSFCCEEVGALPSIVEACAGWLLPMKDEGAPSSHLFSCTVAIKA